MNDLGRVTGTPIWSPAGMIAGFTDRGLHGLGFSDRNAAILSGTTGIQRLFGWKDPHADAYGVSGSFGATDASGQNWQDMSRRGGLFRSDQRWTDTAAFSPSQTGFFTQMMAPINDVVHGLSSLLGVNSSQALAGYNHPFNVQLSDNGKPRSDADISKEFNDLLGHVLQEQVETHAARGRQGRARRLRAQPAGRRRRHREHRAGGDRARPRDRRSRQDHRATSRRGPSTS
jgi:hypothetical protein